MKKINPTFLVFIIFVFGLMITSVILPDEDMSFSEKRELEQFDIPTISTVTDGTWFKSFTTYVSDQFAFREGFRTANAYIRTYGLKQEDIGGIYTQGDYIFKSDYPFDKMNVLRFAEKTNEVYEKFIKGKADNYYVSVIPDKTYFDTSDKLKTDAKEVASFFSYSVIGATYIDIFDSLSLESYYKTDTHWSSDKLFPVVDLFAEKMGFAKPEQNSYNENELSPFYGVYHGQSALNFPSEEIVYLTSVYTESATVENLDKPEFKEVYDLEEFNSEDSYNIFLSGGTPLTKITSPMSKTEDELVIFRDSFGSSIAPLLLENYRTVTLVDLRYFTSDLLDEYVDFEGKDVLVLYSSLILNSDIILR